MEGAYCMCAVTASTAANYFPLLFQTDNERRLLKLCYKGTADISQFSHLLNQAGGGPQHL